MTWRGAGLRPRRMDGARTSCFAAGRNRFWVAQRFQRCDQNVGRKNSGFSRRGSYQGTALAVPIK